MEHPEHRVVTFIAHDPVTGEDVLKHGLLVNFGRYLITMRKFNADFTVVKVDTIEMVCEFVEEWAPSWASRTKARMKKRLEGTLDPTGPINLEVYAYRDVAEGKTKGRRAKQKKKED